MTSSRSKVETDERCYTLAAGVTLFALAYALLHHTGFLCVWRLGQMEQAATIGMVYRKALRISQQALTQTTTGHVVNLVSNDAERKWRRKVPSLRSLNRVPRSLARSLARSLSLSLSLSLYLSLFLSLSLSRARALSCDVPKSCSGSRMSSVNPYAQRL